MWNFLGFIRQTFYPTRQDNHNEGNELDRTSNENTKSFEVIDYETSETKIVDFDGLTPIDYSTYNEEANVSIAVEENHYKINSNGTEGANLNNSNTENVGVPLIYQQRDKSGGENENLNKPGRREDDKKANSRVCREEKPAPCDICLRDLSIKPAVKVCVECCLYFCENHFHVYNIPLPSNEKHTLLAFNVSKEVRNQNFKIYLDKLKLVDLDPEFERKVSLLGLIDVRHESSDSMKCWITGIVLLNDGRLTLLDRNNNCIKFLDLESQKITSYMHIPFKPRYLSEYEIGKGVVTCPDNARLLLIDLKTQSIIKEIRVDGVCRCVGSLRDLFIVSFTDGIQHRAYIQIMNRDGKVLKQLRSIKNDPVFIEPYYLAVDKDRELVYVQDSRESAVMCFNLTGTMLNWYRHEQLKHPQAMTIGPDGDVYVAGMLSRNVHKLSPLLKESHIIIDESRLGLTGFTPLALCMSGQTLYASHAYYSPAGNYIIYFREEL